MSKVCQFCHTACSDETKYCPNCGNRLPAANAPQPKSIWDEHGHPHSTVSPEIEPNRVSIWNGQSHPHNEIATGYSPNSLRLSMVWFRVMIYFLLINRAIMCFGSALAVFGDLTNFPNLFEQIPALGPIEQFYSFALFGMGVFALVVQTKLRKFRKNGPKLYFIMLILDMLIDVIYAAATAIALSSHMTVKVDYYSLIITNLILNGILLAVNAVYFKKRSHMFVNL